MENTWAIRTVKLWFILHQAHKDLPFVQFPSILEDEAFMK